MNQLEGVRISDRTRERVLAAAKALEYHPNAAGRKLVSGKSSTLGLILFESSEQLIVDAFLPIVIRGIEQAAMKQNFLVVVKPVEPGEQDGYSRLVQENYVDGILLAGPRSDDEEIRRLHAAGVPVLLLGKIPGSGLYFVDVDNAAAADKAVTHLIELGHQHIAMITNAPLTFTSAQERRSGYLRALSRRGIQPQASLLKEGNLTPASGYESMEALLSARPRPSAVFVGSDVVAAGALLAVKRAGLRVPEDLALIGFDDIPMAAYFDPPLTTMRLPAYGLGWAAAENLVRLIRGEGLDEPGTILDSELMIRESTGLR
jgi:DNA-binding LacI/PurR family transcriptional regulator